MYKLNANSAEFQALSHKFHALLIANGTALNVKVDLFFFLSPKYTFPVLNQNLESVLWQTCIIHLFIERLTMTWNHLTTLFLFKRAALANEWLLCGFGQWDACKLYISSLFLCLCGIYMTATLIMSHALATWYVHFQINEPIYFTS